MTPSFKEALKFWTKLGFISFGGPAGQIAIMHSHVVEQNKWVSDNQFLRALNFCMLLPGPEAQQLATYLGWRMHGTLGGIAAGTLAPLASGVLGALVTTYVTFLPCFFFIFAGAPFIEAMARNQKLQAALKGITAAVVGVVLNLAVWFGYKIFFPASGPDFFAAGSGILSLVLRQKYHFPIQYLVPLGALSGILWRWA